MPIYTFITVQMKKRYCTVYIENQDEGKNYWQVRKQVFMDDKVVLDKNLTARFTNPDDAKAARLRIIIDQENLLNRAGVESEINHEGKCTEIVYADTQRVKGAAKRKQQQHPRGL